MTFKICFFKRTNTEPRMEKVKNQTDCLADVDLSLSFELKVFLINTL